MNSAVNKSIQYISSLPTVNKNFKAHKSFINKVPVCRKREVGKREGEEEGLLFSVQMSSIIEL